MGAPSMTSKKPLTDEELAEFRKPEYVGVVPYADRFLATIDQLKAEIRRLRRENADPLTYHGIV